MRIYLATGNKGKVEELIPLVKKYIPYVSEVLAQAPKDAEEVEETFLGNARIKSHALLKELTTLNSTYPFYILSDDSGLEVEALDKRPGVHSARYAGDHVSSESHIQKLLSEMQGKINRKCRYVCALNLLKVQGLNQVREFSSEGYCEGEILFEAKGLGGFGYDPIFWVPSLQKRMSEATLDEKNSLSHRQRAFESFFLQFSS
jgi:XTP/dITP diphosphohydrolase